MAKLSTKFSAIVLLVSRQVLQEVSCAKIVPLLYPFRLSLVPSINLTVAGIRERSVFVTLCFYC